MKNNVKYLLLSTVVLAGLGAGTATVAPLANVEPTTVQAAPTINYKVQPVDAATSENIGDPIPATGEINSIITDFPTVKGYKVQEKQNIPAKPGTIKVKYNAVEATALTINYIDSDTGTKITSDTKTIDYDESGNIDLGSNLGSQYKFDKIGEDSTNLGLKVSDDQKTLTYDNKNDSGNAASIDVYYKSSAATVTTKYVDQANPETVLQTDAAEAGVIGEAYNKTLQNQIVVNGKTYEFQGWSVDDKTSGTTTDVSFDVASKDVTVTANYKAVEEPTTPDTNTNYYLPGVYANSSAGIALDPNHYTIVSAGAGVGVLGATAYNKIQFTGILGSAWQVGTRVYVGPFGVWVIAGISPDKKVIVTPLSVDASASAAVAGIDTALSAGATANASAFDGVGAGAAAGITTPTTTEQHAAAVGNVEDQPSGTLDTGSKGNIIDDITNGTIKAVNGVVGGIANTVNKVFGWLF